MQVFKTFIKITLKNLPTAMVYLIVFVIIAICIANSGKSESGFQETKLSVCVIDEDNTDASKALTEYIGSTNELVEIENDKDSILDALFYFRIQYVLTIKEGYEDKLSSGETQGLFTNYQRPGSYSGILFESSLDEYISTVSAFITGGNELSDAVAKAEDALSQEAEVTKETFSNEQDPDYSEKFAYYYQYLSYVLIMVVTNMLCPVLLTMNRKEIKNRTTCSSISMTKQTMQITLGSTLTFIAIWIVFVVIGFFMNDGSLGERNWLAVLNSLVFMFVAAGITLLISSFAPGKNAVSMISNIIGLGMSFLCGAFVPQSLLGDGVLKAARFLPAYWYIRANNMLSGFSGEAFDTGKYMSFLGIEAIFAAAIFAVFLLVTKIKRDEGN